MSETRFKIFAPLLKAGVGEDGKKRLYGIASSTIKDRQGDEIRRSALEDMIGKINEGLTIFLNHQYRVPEDVGGYAESGRIIPTGVLDGNGNEIHDLHMGIVINERNERAVSTWESINNGVQLGISIGAMIPEGGASMDRKSGTYVIEHIDLLEASIVGLPANPRSWVSYAVKALDESQQVEPDEAKAASSIDISPDGAIHIETTDTGTPTVSTGSEEELPTSQETPDGSDPGAEVALAAETPEVGNDEREEDAVVLATEEMDVISDAAAMEVAKSSLDTSRGLITALEAELAARDEVIKSLSEERDNAVKAAEAALRSTARLLDRLGNTPLGRKTVVDDTKAEFDALQRAYGPTFYRILRGDKA